MTAEVRHYIVTQVRAALLHEPRVNLHRFPLDIDQAPDGVLVLAGEMQNIAAKKLALEVAAATPGVTGIVDRIKVAPSRPMADGEIRAHLLASLLDEPAFENCTIRAEAGGQLEILRDLNSFAGEVIELSAEDGVVTLDGMVNSLSHKALAGALAWWVPGTREVTNGIEISPHKEINDAEIREAARLVLDKDPLVRAGVIRVIARNHVVVLEGYVPNPGAREMAEMDAWYVAGVDLVINRVEVQQ